MEKEFVLGVGLVCKIWFGDLCVLERGGVLDFWVERVRFFWE